MMHNEIPNLDSFPRVALAHTPTPLEPLDNLTRELGGARVLVKRDDCTGLAMGGNKARHLEFYLGEARAQGADTVITTGAVQSNHVRMTAAAACKLGMRCEVQLEDRVPNHTEDYKRSGNVLLNRLFGAVIHSYPKGEDEQAADASLESIAARVRAEGGTPYVIHLGADHKPLGALGYVDAARELLAQTTAFDAVVVPTGSASTHAGFLVGLRILGCKVPVFGICVRRDQEAQAQRAAARAAQVCELLGCGGLIEPNDIRVTDAYLGPGYGLATPEVIEAIRMGASLEGLLLDPIYSGKAFAGLIGMLREGTLPKGGRTVFLHTGGTPAMFAYRGMLAGNAG